MNNIMIGVIRKSECCNDVLIPKNISDEVLGDLFADLTLTLNVMRPGALQIASEILEKKRRAEDRMAFIRRHSTYGLNQEEL